MILTQVITSLSTTGNRILILVNIYQRAISWNTISGFEYSVLKCSVFIQGNFQICQLFIILIFVMVSHVYVNIKIH